MSPGRRWRIQMPASCLESKEMISGYFIISANDIGEATELTKQCPLLGQFRLEVRRLKPM